MENRFNLSKDKLSNYIQDAITVIELGTDLKFTRAEDWTMKNQGHVLHFVGNLYKYEDQTLEDVEMFIKAQFAHNPTTKCIYEDTSDFEELATGNEENEWLIYIAI